MDGPSIAAGTSSAAGLNVTRGWRPSSPPDPMDRAAHCCTAEPQPERLVAALKPMRLLTAPCLFGRFMSAKVLEPYCLLLRHFDTNTPEANHCLVKMLHRAAWDHKMPALLFQVTTLVS